MIRVNLNRSRVATAEEASTGVMTAGPSSSAMNTRDVVVKVLAMGLGTIGLLLYQKQNLDSLNAQLTQLSVQANELKKQMDEKSAELSKLKAIEPQARALNDKLKILRQFSKLRLEELQSLDFIQSVIPDRVWLTSVNYAKHQYELRGNAVETVDLSQFVRKLESSAYFEDVIVIQDTTVVSPGGNGKIRQFLVTAHSGGKN